MSTKNKELQKLSPMRQRLLNILQFVERGLLFLHVVLLCCVLFIHFFLPTKLFMGFVGLHNTLLRDYWYFSKNMTEEGGIYGPLFSVLTQDILWVMQIYIPVLLPLVLISHFIRRSEGGQTLTGALLEFILSALGSIIAAVIAGGLLGTIMVAVSYVFAFGFTGPEISGDIGKVFEFPSSGIVIFDLLLGTLLIGMQLKLKTESQKKWMVVTLGSTVLLLIALNQMTEIEVRVETEKEGEEVTAYAHHWLDSVYKKEDVLVIKKLIVRQSRHQILAHEDMVDTLACEADGVDCSTFSWPGTTINFAPADNHLYEKMNAFFHDRPADVGLYGSVIEVSYKVKKGHLLATQAAKVDVVRNQRKASIGLEERSGQYLKVSPLTDEQDWGIQIFCADPEASSILVLSTDEGIAFLRSLNGSITKLDYLHQTEAIKELITLNDGYTSLFVNGEPVLRIEGCDPIHYDPTALGVDGQRVSVSTVRKTIRD